MKKLFALCMGLLMFAVPAKADTVSMWMEIDGAKNGTIEVIWKEYFDLEIWIRADSDQDSIFKVDAGIDVNNYFVDVKSSAAIQIGADAPSSWDIVMANPDHCDTLTASGQAGPQGALMFLPTNTDIHIMTFEARAEHKTGQFDQQIKFADCDIRCGDKDYDSKIHEWVVPTWLPVKTTCAHGEGLTISIIEDWIEKGRAPMLLEDVLQQKRGNLQELTDWPDPSTLVTDIDLLFPGSTSPQVMTLGEKLTVPMVMWAGVGTHVGAFQLAWDYDETMFNYHNFVLAPELVSAGFAVTNLIEHLNVEQTTPETNATLLVQIVGTGMQAAPDDFFNVGHMVWEAVGCGTSKMAINYDGQPSHVATIDPLATLFTTAFKATLPNPDDFGTLYHGELRSFYIPGTVCSGGKGDDDVIAATPSTWSNVKELYK